MRLTRSILALITSVLAIFGAAAPAAAAVEVSFYSKEFGATYPHAFVTVRGIVDRSGEQIDTSYGFTAKHVTPAVLMGSVPGEIIQSSAGYIAKADKHFSLILSDEEYDRFMATVARWRTARQPSYNLNRKNCVHFVAELAAAVGMQAGTPKALMKKPFSYVRHLLQTNRQWLVQRGATITQ
jgi:hypothetical protein